MKGVREKIGGSRGERKSTEEHGDGEGDKRQKGKERGVGKRKRRRK